jgi:DNA-directed RNA polymerase sigma subunit (sigma70/sigma32)
MPRIGLLSRICPDHVTEKQLLENIDALLGKLTERSEYVVRHHYGIGVPSMSLAKIGAQLNIDFNYIRVIHGRSLRKLKIYSGILFENIVSNPEDENR